MEVSQTSSGPPVMLKMCREKIGYLVGSFFFFLVLPIPSNPGELKLLLARFELAITCIRAMFLSVYPNSATAVKLLNPLPKNTAVLS